MSRAPVVAALSVLAPLIGCTDDFEHRPPDADSHIATYFLPEYRPPKLDLLFVVDNTPAMAPWQDKLAELPGLVEAVIDSAERPDLRVAVATNGGALRTSLLVDGPYLDNEQHFDGPRTNYGGSFHDALASLLYVGAAHTGPSQVLDAAELALASEFPRPDAYLAIMTIAATDDASLAPPAYYADAYKATRRRPESLIMSGIYPTGAPRLDELYARFPNRNTTTPIDSEDWSRAFELLDIGNRSTLDLFCFPKPLDVDPIAEGDQFDCAMTFVFDGVERGTLPYCGSSLPCWELEDVTSWGCTGDDHFTMRVHGFSGWQQPEIRGQCVVK